MRRESVFWAQVLVQLLSGATILLAVGFTLTNLAIYFGVEAGIIFFMILHSAKDVDR